MYGLFISGKDKGKDYPEIEILRSEDSVLELKFDGEKENAFIEYVHASGAHVKLEYKKIDQGG